MIRKLLKMHYGPNLCSSIEYITKIETIYKLCLGRKSPWIAYNIDIKDS